MIVNCAESMDRGVMGTCVLTIELLQPQKNNLTYACEVSGERPMFRMETKNIVIEAFGKTLIT